MRVGITLSSSSAGLYFKDKVCSSFCKVSEQEREIALIFCGRLGSQAQHTGELVRHLLSMVIVVCTTILALPGLLRAQNDVEKIYKTNCVLCHAADGSGNSSSGKALGARDLRSDVAQKKTDAELTEVITQGKGKMPAFGKKLKPEDITKLVAYIRALPKGK
jgi:cytochrome c6